ncbi:MAG: Calx-beta domain-containing protein [Polyangiaceae bacterium]
MSWMTTMHRAALARRLALAALLAMAGTVSTTSVGCGGGDSTVEPGPADDGGATGEGGADGGGKVDGSTSDGGTGVDADTTDSAVTDAGTDSDIDGATDGAADAADDGAADGAVDAADASLPTLSIDSVAVDEGNAGTTSLTFTVTLSAASAQTVTADFLAADGTASALGGAVGGADYAAALGAVTFAPGDLTKQISINVNGDTVAEDNETLTVTLSNPSGATIAQAVGTGTINNDDAVPSIAIADSTVIEGNSGTTAADFKVTLSAVSGQTVTVHAKTTDVSATAGTDFTGITDQTVTFNPGETSKTVTVDVTGDVTIEPNESFTVDLSGAVNATIAAPAGTGTIQNDDGAANPSISITDPSVTEGNAGTKTMTFTVSLGAASAQTVTVDFKTADGTATSGGVAAAGGLDYEAASGTVTFAPAETSKDVSITINGDTFDEADETFALNLSNAQNGIIAKAQGVGTITNDDGAPSVTIDDVAVDEGQAGTTNLVFTATLSNTSGRAVKVDYATADGTAKAGGALASGGQDYLATSGTLTFPPGTSTQTVSVAVNGDVLNEVNETLTVTLSNPVNVTLGGKSQGVGTITNDDAAPSIVINDVAVNEGNSGTTAMSFTVTLVDATNAPVASGRSVSVDYATADVSATAGSDYVATTGTLTFAPGVTTQNVVVQANGDVTSESNETFNVVLSNASNATLLDATGVGTITNDDGTLPFLNVTDTSITEGNSGTTLLTYTVTLSAAAAANVTVQYTTADGTANSGGALATGGQDYVPTSGTLTFTPGQLSKNVTVTVNGDTVNEGDDTVQLVLFNPSANAVIQDGLGVGAITNDDAAPTLSINDVTVTEGNAGTKTATFTVTLSTGSGQTVQVNYATADGSAHANGVLAAGGQDYVTTSGTLTFDPGQTTKNVVVTINGDTTYEPNETYSVTLSQPVHATLADSSGAGSITNDDSVPSITINDVSLNEGTPVVGQRLTTSFTFTVTLSNPRSVAVTALYITGGGTATAGTDYTATAGTVTIPAGSTTATITVLVHKDATLEPNETFNVTLSSPTNATISDGTGVGTIKNDD